MVFFLCNLCFTWLYLLTLAISDTVTSIIQVPFYIAPSINEEVLSFDGVCKAQVATWCFYFCSVYIMVAVSVEKFKMVSKPFESLNGISYRQFSITGIITCVMLLPLILAVFTASHVKGTIICNYVGKVKFIWLIGSILYDLLPLMLILLFTLMTIFVLRKQSEVRKVMTRTPMRETYLQNMRMTKMPDN